MANNKDFKVKNGIQPAAYQESLGTIATGSVTVGYDLSVAAYDSVSFSVTSQETVPRDVAFKDDGTKMFLIGQNGDDVNEYALSTAWDISTASYTTVFSVSSQTTSPRSIQFNADGTAFFICGSQNNQAYQYTLSTAWDISTASYASDLLYLSNITDTVSGVFLSSDGTKLYANSYSNDAVYQYTLSTAYDLSTGSYDSVSFDYSSQGQYSEGMTFNPDGTKMYLSQSSNRAIYEYSLSTAWDLSTTSYTGNNFGVASEDLFPYGITFKPDGTKMYMVGNYTDTIYQYSTGSTLTTNTLDLSTGSVFEITPAANTQVSLSNPAASGTVSSSTLLLDGVAAVVGYDLAIAAYNSVSFSVNSQDINPLDIAFNTDGTKMYIMGSTSDSVLQYSLSTGFDLSTASYDSVSFNVSSQDTNPRKLSFNNDGTKLYIFGTITDTVYQYSLSTAFDLSTTSYDSVSFNAASQATNPYGLAFNSDGTKMYLGSGTVFYQYSLSTAFDLSTTSYDSVSFNVSSQDSDTPDLTFNNDGTKMYVVGTSNDNVYQYSLSTAFDLSTASYDSVSFSIGSQNDAPTALAFSNDGTKMYIVGNINDTVYQYTTGTSTPMTITWDSSIKWSGGTAPDSPAASETDVYYFSTRDGGTSYIANIAIDGAK